MLRASGGVDRDTHARLPRRRAGAPKNQNGISAHVTITPGGGRLTRAAQLAGSYCSVHYPRVHFGLSETDRVDQIELHWPEGTTGTMQNSAANRDAYVTVSRKGEMP